MQRFVIGVLAVGLLGAGATVGLVDRYIDQRIERTTAEITKNGAPVFVLVAKGNLPIGKKIARGDLVWQPWPKDGVQSDFLSAAKPDTRKMGQIVGAVARRGIIKGTPITKQAVFKSKNPGFLAGALDPNMRAISISVSAQSGAAGFILPGDRVDVILIQDVGKKTRSKKSGSAEATKSFHSHIAETILQNVRVLASDQKVSDFEKKAKVAKTVTLEVTRKQAEALAVAGSMGKLSLALRSFSDVTNDEAAKLAQKKAIAEAITAAKGPTTTTDLEVSPLLAATKNAAIKADAPKAKPISKKLPAKSIKEAKGSKPKVDGIRIYRGGLPSTVRVN
jgi:pilus assembly protein CpaB